jgi:Helicase associated domain
MVVFGQGGTVLTQRTTSNNCKFITIENGPSISTTRRYYTTKHKHRQQSQNDHTMAAPDNDLMEFSATEDSAHHDNTFRMNVDDVHGIRNSKPAAVSAAGATASSNSRNNNNEEQDEAARSSQSFASHTLSHNRVPYHSTTATTVQQEEQNMNRRHHSGGDNDSDDDDDVDEALRSHNLAAASARRGDGNGQQHHNHPHHHRQRRQQDSIEDLQEHQQRKDEEVPNNSLFLTASDRGNDQRSHGDEMVHESLSSTSNNYDDTEDMTAEEVLQAAMLGDYEEKDDFGRSPDKKYKYSDGDQHEDDDIFNTPPDDPHPDDEDYHPNPILPATGGEMMMVDNGDYHASFHHRKRRLEDASPDTVNILARDARNMHYDEGYNHAHLGGGGRHQDDDYLGPTKKMRAMVDSHDNTGVHARTAYRIDNSNPTQANLSSLSSMTAAASAASSKKVNNEQWDAMFEKLKAYKAQFGSCLVPKRYAVDPRLGTWVSQELTLFGDCVCCHLSSTDSYLFSIILHLSLQVETQRNQRKKLKSLGVCPTTGKEIVEYNNRLNAERLAKLEEIGFAWSAKHVRKNNTGKNGTTAAASGSNKKEPPSESSAASSPSSSPINVPIKGDTIAAIEGNESSVGSGKSNKVQKSSIGGGPKSARRQPQQPQLQQQRKPRLNETQWDGKS